MELEEGLLGLFDELSPADQRTMIAMLIKAASVEGEVQSFGMMSLEESARLQMTVDGTAKAQSTLSNLLKRYSDISQTIIQNLK